MRETAGIAAAPAARCRKRRRGPFVAFTLNGWPCSMAASTGRRCVRRLFDTIGGVSTLLLRRSLMLMGPSFVPLAALGQNYTDFPRVSHNRIMEYLAGIRRVSPP